MPSRRNSPLYNAYENIQEEGGPSRPVSRDGKKRNQRRTPFLKRPRRCRAGKAIGKCITGKKAKDCFYGILFLIPADKASGHLETMVILHSDNLQRNGEKKKKKLLQRPSRN